MEQNKDKYKSIYAQEGDAFLDMILKEAQVSALDPKRTNLPTCPCW